MKSAIRYRASLRAGGGEDGGERVEGGEEQKGLWVFS